MIHIQHDTGNLIEVTVTDTLQEEDFRQLGAAADTLIRQQGSICLLIDATHFNGWDDLDAAEKHFGFVKGHHEKVEKLAILIGHQWQRWLVTFAKMFLHPAVKVFNKDEKSAAKAWLQQG